MALHLNLYHETARARQAKRRDPLKLSLYALAAIGAALAGYYFLQLSAMSDLSRELARKKAEYDAIEPEAKKAREREEELASTIKLSSTLVSRIEERFYWAPVLEQIVKVVPRQVQITRLSGDVQGDDLKRCTLTLDGISAGTDPRKVAEDLRTAIADEFAKNYKDVSSTFRSLEDGKEMVKLDGQEQPTATFAINVQLSSGEAPEPAPAPRQPKK
jgi:Tfp pilus assembly protein PilN